LFSDGLEHSLLGTVLSAREKALFDCGRRVMDANDPEVRRVFFDLHNGLPREGPGDRDCKARALAIAGPLPEAPRVLDIACGPCSRPAAGLP
jgi:hypothetical protein